MAWWNASYASRAQLALPARPEGYAAGSVVKSRLTETRALIVQGLMRPDRKDCRVVYDSGSAVEIDRVLSDTGTIFFRVQAAIPPNAASADYWLYYGNPAEATSPAANPRNALAYYADGDDLAVLTKTGTVSALSIPKPAFLKFGANPIVKRSAVSTDGDYMGARDCETFYFDGANYRLIYTGYGGASSNPPANESFASSPDLLTWSKNLPWKVPPIYTDPGGLTLLDQVACGVLMIMGRFLIGGSMKWYGTYIGVPDNAHYSIPGYFLHGAVADSIDGPWTKAGLLLPPGAAGSYDCGGTGDGYFATFDGGATYVMVYEAYDNNNARSVALATATSPAGPWTKLGRILGGPMEQLENPRIAYDAARGVYYVWANHLLTEYPYRGVSNALYWSTDLRSWSPANKTVLIETDPGAWDSFNIGLPSPPVFKDGMQYALYDAGNAAAGQIDGPYGFNQYGREIGQAEGAWPYPWANAFQLAAGASIRTPDLLTGDGSIKVRGRRRSVAATISTLANGIGIKSASHTYYVSAYNYVDLGTGDSWNYLAVSVDGAASNAADGEASDHVATYEFRRVGSTLTILQGAYQVYSGPVTTEPLSVYAFGDVTIEEIRSEQSTAVLAPTVAISGEADATASGGAGPITQLLAGSSSGTASASATLAVQPPLAAAAGGQAGATATLASKSSSPKRLFSVASGDGATVVVGTPVWNVTAGDAIPCGIGIAPTGYYGPGAALSGSAGGHAGATALPGVVQGLAGVAPGHAGGSGTIPLASPSGEADAHGGAAAALSQARPLQGEADAHAGATATGLQFPTPLAGVAAGHGAAFGSNPTDTPLAAKSGAHGSASAALRVDLPLSARAEGQAAARAEFAGPPIAANFTTARRVFLGLYAHPVRLGTVAHRNRINVRALHE